jgi:hypothetical protein
LRNVAVFFGHGSRWFPGTKETKMDIVIAYPNQLKRAQEALEQTIRFIAEESPRRADLRPTDVQKHLDFCIVHKVRLEQAIENYLALGASK